MDYLVKCQQHWKANTQKVGNQVVQITRCPAEKLILGALAYVVGLR